MLIIFLQEVKGVIFAYFPPEIGRKITLSYDPYGPARNFLGKP